MKIIYHCLSLILFVVVASAQSLIVQVENPADFDRKLETIEIPWSDIGPKIEIPEGFSVQVTENGISIPCQLLDSDGNGTPDLLLFQSSFKKMETKQFTIGAGKEFKCSEAGTDAKYILPRKDVAWENDRIAFRIYGGPLAGDVRNGLDVWVKRVRYHIMDKWYNGDSLKGKARISYHVDHGEGADMFNVGKSLGAGGSALWLGSGMFQTGLFTEQQIIATGPVRTMFTVRYDTVFTDGKKLTEFKTYTLDAGENLNKIEVLYIGLPQKDPITIAAGLVKRPHTHSFADESVACLSLWGLISEDSVNGDLGIGAVVPKAVYKGMQEDSTHYLILGTSAVEEPFTYYAGAGWTRSGDFASEDDWNNYLKTFTLRLEHPLHVTVRSKTERKDE
jgi:pectinesterase